MNKVMLIGNVGKEPDVRYYDHDQAVAQFPLATTERGYTLQNGTKVPDHTDWHTIMVWRGLAKIVEKYVHKGDKLYIEGIDYYTQGEFEKAIEKWKEVLVLFPRFDPAKQGITTAQNSIALRKKIRDVQKLY